MHRQCDVRKCERIAFYAICASAGFETMACQAHVATLFSNLSGAMREWVQLFVVPLNALVTEDSRDWRTRGTIAYDVKRQIGA